MTSIHSASRRHMANVLTHDALVPLDSRVTLPHAGHTAVTHGMMRFSTDSTVARRLPPSLTRTDA